MVEADHVFREHDPMSSNDHALATMSALRRRADGIYNVGTGIGCEPRHALPDGLRDEIGWLRAEFGGNLKTAA